MSDPTQQNLTNGELLKPDPTMGKAFMIKLIKIVSILFLAILAYFLIPDSLGSGDKVFQVNELHRRTIVVFVIAAGFWATEVIPLFATSFLIIIIQIFLLASNGGGNKIVTDKDMVAELKSQRTALLAQQEKLVAEKQMAVKEWELQKAAATQPTTTQASTSQDPTPVAVENEADTAATQATTAPSPLQKAEEKVAALDTQINEIRDKRASLDFEPKKWRSRWLPTFGEAPKGDTKKGAAILTGLSYKRLLNDFSSPLIMLFLGGFLLSSALTKHGMDRKLASVILTPFNKKPITLLFGVLGISAFFSMWMSNTATAAMMLALMVPILRNVDEKDAFHRALILAVPFGANIGGIGTPIGTPPNAIAYKAINDMIAPKSISFLDWMILAVPLEIILLIGSGLLLYFLFPPKKDMKLAPIESPGKITIKGWVTFAILLVGIFLWLTAKPLTIGGWQIPLTGNGIHSGVVALVMAMSLCVIGLLDKNDVDTIDWNILILMWGGLAMGTALKITGTAQVISVIPFEQIWGGEYTVAVLVALVAVTMSTFMSNTATAALLLPIVLALSLVPGAEGNPELQVTNAKMLIQIGVLAGLACSFAMALPVSTPPNAMAYATGKIPTSAMLRAGTIVSIVSIIVMIIGYKLMIPTILNLEVLTATVGK